MANFWDALSGEKDADQRTASGTDVRASLAHRLRRCSRVRLVLSPRAAAPRARVTVRPLTAGSGTVSDSVRPHRARRWRTSKRFSPMSATWWRWRRANRLQRPGRARKSSCLNPGKQIQSDVYFVDYKYVLILRRHFVTSTCCFLNLRTRFG